MFHEALNQPIEFSLSTLDSKYCKETIFFLCKKEPVLVRLTRMRQTMTGTLIEESHTTRSFIRSSCNLGNRSQSQQCFSTPEELLLCEVQLALIPQFLQGDPLLHLHNRILEKASQRFEMKEASEGSRYLRHLDNWSVVDLRTCVLIFHGVFKLQTRARRYDRCLCFCARVDMQPYLWFFRGYYFMGHCRVKVSEKPEPHVEGRDFGIKWDSKSLDMLYIFD